jgi:membrane fusion protein, heavy metal efflux system
MTRASGLALIGLLAAGCGARDEKAQGHAAQEAAPSPPAHAGHEDAAPHAGAGEAAVVHIEAGMLRDLRITTGTVETRSGAESAPVPADLRVPDEAYAEVGSPVPARVLHVSVTAGEPVRRGQLLATLQSLELGRARGDYGSARARAELARAARDRKRGLAAERIAPGREVQEAEAELKAAEANLAAAGDALRAMGASASAEGGPTLRLLAPLSGTVIERDLARGQVVAPAHTAFRIGSLATLWVIAHAPERDAVRVPRGGSARVAVPALPGRTLAARVVLVGGLVEASSRTIPVRLLLANPDGALRAGMSATVWLPVGEGSTVLAVPAAALQRLGEDWCVFVPRAEGVFEARTVGRGRDLGGEVEVLSGLRAGETIVVEGAFLLKAEADKARGEGADHDH